jgi:hypothetical protein
MHAVMFFGRAFELVLGRFLPPQVTGYATGLVTFALQADGLSTQDPTVARGIAWLRQNQNESDGSWPSWSVNEKRGSSSNVGHFMRDAATAYAVLALTAQNASQATAERGRTAKAQSAQRASTFSKLQAGSLF